MSRGGKKGKTRHPIPTSHHPPELPNPTSGRSVSSVSMQQITIQGPLPPPSLLRQYEEIHPGFTNRLLTAVEEQGRHRRAMDQPTLDANFRLARAGQNIAGIVCVAALGSGTFLVSTGHSPVGIALLFSVIASVVGPFLLWKRRRHAADEPARGTDQTGEQR